MAATRDAWHTSVVTKTTTTSKRTGKKTSKKTTSKRSGRAKKAKPAAPASRLTKEEREAQRATKRAVDKAASEAKREAAAIERIQKRLADKMVRIEAASAAKAAKAAESTRKAEEKAKAIADKAEARASKRAALAAEKARQIEDRQAAADAKRLEWAQKKNITNMDREKAQRLAFRVTASSWPREQWVTLIKSPAQRILADVSARVCALFGLPPDALRGDRRDQSPRSRNENSLRGIALGAVIDVGVAMGLSWNELHTHPETGRAEVLDLPPHAHTIRIAHARWLAVLETEGIVLEVAKGRVADIKAMACARMDGERK